MATVNDCIESVEAEQERENIASSHLHLDSHSVKSNRLGSKNNWWRWPLIPILAPVGAIVGSTLIGIIQWVCLKIQGDFHEDGWYYLYILPLITSGILGWLWCHISAAVAPVGKTMTGAVMATVLTMLLIFITFLALSTLEKTTGEQIQLVLAIIATVIGSLISVVETYETEKKKLW